MSIFDRYDEEEQTHVSRVEETDYSYTDPETVDQKTVEAPTHFAKAFHLVYASVIMVALVGRLAIIQIIQGRTNAHLAQQHSVRQIIVAASRGAVFDSRGVWLARNTPSFRVQISPNDLPRIKSERAKIYDNLAQVLHWSDDQKNSETSLIESKLLNQLDPIILQDSVAHDDALILQEKLNDVPATSVVAQQLRQYNQSTTGLSHILGYVGRVSEKDLQNDQLLASDNIGKSGVELSYDSTLRGKSGVQQALVDSRGKVLQTITDSTKDPVAGHDLVLGIDLKLQQVMYQQLSDGLQKAGLKSGVAIAMDPRNGSIRGMVSLPTYDNNQFAPGIPSDLYQSLANNPDKPLFNRATQGTFPSGSTIKPFMAAVGLQDGVITEQTRIDTPAEIQIGQQVFPNWQHFFIPNVDVKTAIAKSNDIFFYAVGGGFDKIKGLGINAIDQGLPWFGFGSATGVDLPSESVGRVPTPDWKKALTGQPWFIGDTYHLSIGQGDFLVTPLQLASALSAVANGGTLYQPHVVDRVVDADGKTVQNEGPTVLRQHFIDDNNMRIVREGMRQAVTDGSGRQLQDLPVSSGAKTGTAQVGVGNEFLESWFEAFAPYDNPEIAIVVLGEKGSQQNEGNTTAEPIANEILKQYFSPDFKK